MLIMIYIFPKEIWHIIVEMETIGFSVQKIHSESSGKDTWCFVGKNF